MNSLDRISSIRSRQDNTSPAWCLEFFDRSARQLGRLYMRATMSPGYEAHSTVTGRCKSLNSEAEAAEWLFKESLGGKISLLFAVEVQCEVARLALEVANMTVASFHQRSPSCPADYAKVLDDCAKAWTKKQVAVGRLKEVLNRLGPPAPLPAQPANKPYLNFDRYHDFADLKYAEQLLE